ncbi:MAG: N-acetylmuramoyl-L-alanine amidase [Bacteroidales bacterium]|nr:N-acetylmuramoyl-L-alanine amidase [Bacteroidales bacterium]
MRTQFTRKFGGAIIALLVTSLIAIVSIGDYTPIKEIKASNSHVIVCSGHDPVFNGEYMTYGKQSPTWEDGLKIYEGRSCQLLALELTEKLIDAQIDVTYLNPYSHKLSLLERVTEVNKIFKIDKRVLLISLHHNAQQTKTAPYIDKYGQKGYLSTADGGATGIESYTSVGYTESDNLNNNFIIPELQKEFPDIKFRTGHKTLGKEANFYVLTQTNCTAVLIEWMFMTTYTDCLIISNSDYRNRYTDAICRALVSYDKSRAIRSGKSITKPLDIVA